MSAILDGEQLLLVDGFPVTISFQDEQVTGTAACNAYFGTYTALDGRISFEELGSTEMACSPPEVMQLETAYLDALARVTGFVVGDELVLSGEGISLTFESVPPVPTADLTDTVWVLERPVDDDVPSSTVGDRATLELFTDGSLIGSTGCRTLTGRYVVLGAEVQVPELTAQGECPEEVRDQDSLVVAVIGDGFMVEIAGDTLTVTSGEGQGLVYTAEG